MIEKLNNAFILNKNKLAYIINDESITYKELLNKSKFYADLLKRQGNEPVIIFGHKTINMLVSIFACIFANRTYIPIDICTPLPRIIEIIKLTGASLIIANETLNCDNIIEVKTLKDLIIYENANYINVDKKNDIIYIIFTSGSTGEPKGVPITETNLLNFIYWISNLKPLNEYKEARVLNQASFSFDLSVADIYYALCNGHTLVGLDKEKQDGYGGIFKIIMENKINIIIATPTFIKMCLLNPEFNSTNYPSVRCMYFCGEVLDKKNVEKIFNSFPNIKIINAYGPTEATSAVTGIVITKEMLIIEDNLPVGKIDTSATEIYIENAEIVLKGKSVFNGYINNLSGGYFLDNGINCYKTGDIGFIKDGKLYFKGRKDNQIKFKGYRIEIGDIEKNLNRIKGVRDCAVVAKKNEYGAVKTIKAFVVLDLGIDEDYVKTELEKIIPNYMMPKIIKKLNELPINKNGKIDRKLLSEL